MKKLLIMLAMVFTAGSAWAYDAVFNFTHPLPGVVQSFRIKYGSVKGGPYTGVVQCGKPALKTDGSYDCPATNLNLDPLYAVAIAVDAAGQESLPSNEASYDPVPPAPGSLKYTISGTVILTPLQ